MLVGGQALAFWVARFGIPVSDGPRVYISADADFLGLAAHVDRFSKALGGKAVYPPKRGLSALVGAVEKDAGGRTIGVDVLHSIVGLDADAVRKRAITVTHPGDPSLRFSVMDPVDCLVSRFENLRRIAEKQNEVGIWQARMAIAACRAYVEELIRLDDERKAIRIATALFQLAGSATGLQAYAKHGLDILEAIPLSRFSNANFRNEQAVRSLANITKAREDFSTGAMKR
ncbi:MAG: hypothetical protein AB7O31_09140 [Burkholderiales bacterium]